MSLLRSLAAADQYLARRLAQPLAQRVEALLGIDCFRLARLAALVSLCGDAVVNLSLLRWGGLATTGDVRFETSLSFAIGIVAAGAVILRSLQLQQEKQNFFSAASPASLAFKYGRWLILAYAAFTSACFLGGVGLALAGTIAPSFAASLPPFALLRFLTDRFGDASFLLALHCLDLRPRGTGSKRAAVTAA
jgi:hypothetical protein